MKYCLPLSCVWLLICSQGLAANEPSRAPLVLLISVDGMKPEAVIDAQRHGLKVPNLRAFMADGVYARGGRGGLPALTHPTHTTVLSGAPPATPRTIVKTTFAPLPRAQQGWVLD